MYGTFIFFFSTLIQTLFYINDHNCIELQIITVELSRGWNSRLGFSLRNEPNSMQTTISAIYNDSVAAKDGRLRVGDKILMVSAHNLIIIKS